MCVCVCVRVCVCVCVCVCAPLCTHVTSEGVGKVRLSDICQCVILHIYAEKHCIISEYCYPLLFKLLGICTEKNNLCMRAGCKHNVEFR